MPKNKFQEVVFTFIMALFMVYGMIVYNVSLNMHYVSTESFLIALKEMPIMVPIAFILEFLFVGRIARFLAFRVVTPSSNSKIITYVISICICCIMCPIMSFIAVLLFSNNKTFGCFFQTWGLNFPMAIMYQLFYCGPVVRFIFELITKLFFKNNLEKV